MLLLVKTHQKLNTNQHLSCFNKNTSDPFSIGKYFYTQLVRAHKIKRGGGGSPRTKGTNP